MPRNNNRSNQGRNGNGNGNGNNARNNQWKTGSKETAPAASKVKDAVNVNYCTFCNGWHKHPQVKCKRNPSSEKPFECKTCGKQAGHKTVECNKSQTTTSSQNTNTSNDKANQSTQWNNEYTAGQHKFPTNNQSNSSEIELEIQEPYQNVEMRDYTPDAKKGEKCSIIDQSYCKLCNDTDHKTQDCKNAENFLACGNSKFWCVYCHDKGHMADECRNPISQKCVKCMRKGHVAKDCNINPNASARLQFQNTTVLSQLNHDFEGKRFRWTVADEDKLNVTQQLRHEIDQLELLGLQKYSRMNDQAKLDHDQELEARKKYVADLEKKLFSGEQEDGITPVERIGLSRPGTTILCARSFASPDTARRFNLTPAASSKPVRHGGISKSSSNKEVEQYRRNLRNLSQANGWTLDEVHEWEQAYFKVRESKNSEEVKAIREKIQKSYRSYKFQEYTRLILSNESAIREHGVLTNTRMIEVKKELMKGARFYRDPRALQNLFARKIPRCECCGTEGTFFDRHFTQIPPMSKSKDLYELDDDSLNDWGIFVGFNCEKRCSSDRGFNYHDRYESDFEGYDMETEDYQKWEVC